jgi:hypothetical protein
MSKFCAINIQNSHVVLLDVEKKGKNYSIAEYSVIDKSELPKHIKNKKNIFLSIEQDEVVDEKISIESVIKNDSVIRSIILRKLQESNPNERILFNYSPLPQNQNDEKTTYQIDGVYEERYLNALKLIDDLSVIERATTNKFSLLGISNECIKEENYFSIHTQANKITTIAVHNGSLIFSRVNTIVANDARMREVNLVEEITQTIAYVQQNFRDINFSVIALSGSLAIDDIIVEHIHMMSQIGISVLYPNTFIKGFEGEEAHQYIFSLGSWYVPKKFQFLPTSILGLKQYALSLKTLLGASIVLAFIGFYLAYDKFDSYSNSLQEYEIVKNRLNILANKTDTYSNEKLDKSLRYIQMSEKYLEHHPLDIILSLKPLIELEKPEELKWSYLENSLTLTATFKKSFNSLIELYEFEKLFFSEFEDMNITFTKKYSVKTDYKKMDFDTTITIENSQEEAVAVEERRRR